MRTAAIYSISYVNWKYNRKIYGFILYAAPGAPKVHLLNIGARDLNVAHKAKLANLIARLIKIPAARQWDGATLYRIFKTYLPKEVSLCYRTLFSHLITQVACINTGFNDPASFTDLDLSQTNQALFAEANSDFYIKTLNMYTGRGVKMKTIQDSFVQATAPLTKVVPNNVVETTPKPDAKKPDVAKTPQIKKPEIKGYY